jgi:DDE superfamily endonuclease
MAFPQRLQRAVDAVATLGRGTEEQTVRLFCQDETRIGLHLPPGRRLTRPGVKPLKVMAPVYDYYWLYAAVEPATGEACWLELPRLDSACFQLFLERFSREYADSFNLLVLDNAPAHVARGLRVPDNVVLIDLPPYCPELNPVERLWQDLKRRLTALAATMRLSITTLREAVEEFIRAYTLEQLASLTGYAYLRAIAMH